MIQRIQSVWLLLATIFAIVTLNQPFKFGSILGQPSTNFTGSSDIKILILTILIAVISAVSIFLFKDRKKQLTLTSIDILLSLGNIALYFYATKDWLGNVSLTAIFAFVIPIFLFFAAKGISRDQKLLKSVDRLRD